MKVALIIVFNHKFEKNITILEKIYAGRFTDIYYIMPFYTGERKDVISVYENSYYFEGYIAQAFQKFYKTDYDYYYFISDDLILNPSINESNFDCILSLHGREAYIPEIKQLHDQQVYWRWTKEAYEYSIVRKGIEAVSELPSLSEAIERFKLHQLDLKPLKYKQVYNIKINTFIYERFSQFIPLHIGIKKYLEYIKHGFKFKLNYPIVGSYADTFTIPGYAIKKFCHYCGVFAATELFPELAIPTAMAFSCDRMRTENELKLKGKVIWNRYEIESYRKQFKDLDDFMSHFPNDHLYVHPIKLSKWNI